MLPKFFILDGPDVYYSDESLNPTNADEISQFVEGVLAGRIDGKGEGTTIMGKIKKVLGKAVDFMQETGIFSLPFSFFFLSSFPYFFIFFFKKKMHMNIS